MIRMRAMDAAFLAMERPAEPRHIGSVSIFGPGPSGPLTYDVVRAQLEARLALIRSARRVVVAAPLGLGRPSWAASEGFDIEFHVQHDAVAEPHLGADHAEGADGDPCADPRALRDHRRGVDVSPGVRHRPYGPSWR